MHRFSIPILLLLLFLVSGCNRTQQSGEKHNPPPGLLSSIDGLLEDGTGYEVILEEMAAREYIPVDTATVGKNGGFSIRFEPDQTAFYALRIGQTGYITLLIEPGEKIRFTGIYGQPQKYELEGSKGSILLSELDMEHKKALSILGDIAREGMEMQTNPDYVRIKENLDFRFDSVTADFREYSLEFIHQNPESLAIIIALYNLYGQGLPVFHPAEDMAVYTYVDSVLSLHYKEFELVELLHAQIMEAEATVQKKDPVPGPTIGEIAPDFVSSQPDGGEMSLRDLRGNYVLLSFWAGWSNLSREENMVLREAWSKYRELPLRIMQVSLDGERDVWLQAIEEDKLEWNHVSDLRRWETAVANLYRVDKIPSNFLIDPRGKIVGVDLFEKELLKRLEQLNSN
jgi:peroxiredoxin